MVCKKNAILPQADPPSTFAPRASAFAKMAMADRSSDKQAENILHSARLGEAPRRSLAFCILHLLSSRCSWLSW